MAKKYIERLQRKIKRNLENYLNFFEQHKSDVETIFIISLRKSTSFKSF